MWVWGVDYHGNHTSMLWIMLYIDKRERQREEYGLGGEEDTREYTFVLYIH